MGNGRHNKDNKEAGNSSHCEKHTKKSLVDVGCFPVDVLNIVDESHVVDEECIPQKIRQYYSEIGAASFASSSTQPSPKFQLPSRAIQDPKQYSSRQQFSNTKEQSSDMLNDCERKEGKRSTRSSFPWLSPRTDSAADISSKTSNVRIKKIEGPQVLHEMFIFCEKLKAGKQKNSESDKTRCSTDMSEVQFPDLLGQKDSRPRLFSAIDRNTNNKVIVKAIRRDKVPQIKGSDIAWREMCLKLLNMKPCKRLMKIDNILECKDNYYLVLEKMHGGELFDFLVTERAVPEETCIYIFRQILLAIDCLHCNGLLHRDIKPENIMFRNPRCGEDSMGVWSSIANNGHNDEWPDVEMRWLKWIKEYELCLVDFDTCYAYTNSNHCERDCATGRRRLVGTYGYLPPEILRGMKYSRKSDLWSAGVILYVLMTGHPPVPMEKMTSAKNCYDVLMSTEAKGINFNLSPLNLFPKAADLCRRLLTFQVDSRIGSAAEALKHPWMRTSLPPALHIHLGEAYNKSATPPNTSRRENCNLVKSKKNCLSSDRLDTEDNDRNKCNGLCPPKMHNRVDIVSNDKKHILNPRPHRNNPVDDPLLIDNSNKLSIGKLHAEVTTCRNVSDYTTDNSQKESEWHLCHKSQHKGQKALSIHLNAPSEYSTVPFYAQPFVMGNPGVLQERAECIEPPMVYINANCQYCSVKLSCYPPNNISPISYTTTPGLQYPDLVNTTFPSLYLPLSVPITYAPPQTPIYPLLIPDTYFTALRIIDHQRTNAVCQINSQKQPPFARDFQIARLPITPLPSCSCLDDVTISPLGSPRTSTGQPPLATTCSTPHRLHSTPTVLNPYILGSYGYHSCVSNHLPLMLKRTHAYD